MQAFMPKSVRAQRPAEDFCRLIRKNRSNGTFRAKIKLQYQETPPFPLRLHSRLKYQCEIEMDLALEQLCSFEMKLRRKKKEKRMKLLERHRVSEFVEQEHH